MRENEIVYVLSDLDRLCLVAKECYRDSGVVLMTPDQKGSLLPEVAHVVYSAPDAGESDLPSPFH